MNRGIRPAKKQAGFTLLEVLVALAVLALGMGTVLKVSASQTRQLSYLQDKTIATWIASNKVNEIRLQQAPATGLRSGHVFMAQREWRWQMQVSPTRDKALLRLDIAVYRADENDAPLLRFIAFTGKKHVVPGK